MQTSSPTYLLMFVIFIGLIESDEKSSKKLQIGIKKRVENCNPSMKSKRGHLLHIHYTGTLDDGQVFDSSRQPHGSERPLTFTFGFGQVIQGWEQGIMGMCVGEQRKLVIPPELAYGVRGAPPKIPPNATLTFHVELVKIENHLEL